jgi:uncharacterized lipoprotein NlpE involved in copper resistance
MKLQRSQIIAIIIAIISSALLSGCNASVATGTGTGVEPFFREFVLGNKVMVGTVNANREYFEMGVKDMAQAEAEYSGWLARLLTHPVKGLENYKDLFEKLTAAKGAIKVYCEVADL